MTREIKPSIVQRNNGTFAARWPDQGGKWQWAGGFVKREEAEAYSVRMKLAARGDVEVIRHDITFAELARVWLAGRIDLSDNTIHTYEEHINTRLNPTFGADEVRYITYHHVQAWLKKFASHRRNAKHKAYSASTLQGTKTVLKQIFDLAIEDGILHQNPATSRHVSYPKLREGRKTIALSNAQAYELFDELRRYAHGRHLVLVWTLLTTQLRIGEALGLTWDDFDPEKKVLNITHRMDERTRVAKDVKSHAGNRTISLDDQTVTLLMEHQRTQEEYRTYAIDPEVGHLIFPKRDGKPMGESVVRMAMKKCGERAGIDNLHSHVMRKSGATLLINSGVPIAVVSERLGHSDPSITWRYYAGVADGDEYLAVRELNRLTMPPLDTGDE